MAGARKSLNEMGDNALFAIERRRNLTFTILMGMDVGAKTQIMILPTLLPFVVAAMLPLKCFFVILVTLNYLAGY